MANEEHLARLRAGVRVWNAWRKEQPSIVPDLSKANLGLEILPEPHLSWTIIGNKRTVLGEHSWTDIAREIPPEAPPTSIVQVATAAGPNLDNVNLDGTNLAGASLRGVSLENASFRYTNLEEAKLEGASLGSAIFRGGNLAGANLPRARLYETVFLDVDLSNTKGLEACIHWGPSSLDHRTLQRSGRLPLPFLRGCGLPDRLIDNLPSLLEDAIQYYSCFISYSSKDDAFAKRLHADLQNNGVRCWFAPHDLPIGAKTWDAIDEAIRLRDKVLLILSKRAIASDWVEDEVTKAFAEERRRNKLVLFPVRIDDTVMKTDEPWAVKLRDQRNIGDFRKSKDHDAYQQAFKRVLRDLKAVAG